MSVECEVWSVELGRSAVGLISSLVLVSVNSGIKIDNGAGNARLHIAKVRNKPSEILFYVTPAASFRKWARLAQQDMGHMPAV